MNQAKRIPRKLKKKIKNCLLKRYGSLKEFGQVYNANKEGFLIQTYSNAESLINI